MIDLYFGVRMMVLLIMLAILIILLLIAAIREAVWRIQFRHGGKQRKK